MGDKEIIYKVTSLIPQGKVLTYASLAKISGIKNPRVVGNYLHKNEDPHKIPCHRVVTSKGNVALRYAFGGDKIQIEKLLEEGVEIINGKVNLSKHLWNPQAPT